MTRLATMINKNGVFVVIIPKITQWIRRSLTRIQIRSSRGRTWYPPLPGSPDERRAATSVVPHRWRPDEPCPHRWHPDKPRPWPGATVPPPLVPRSLDEPQTSATWLVRSPSLDCAAAVPQWHSFATDHDHCCATRGGGFGHVSMASVSVVLFLALRWWKCHFC